MKDCNVIEILCYPSYKEERETYLGESGDFIHIKDKAKKFNSFNEAVDYIYNKKYVGLIYTVRKFNYEPT